MPQTTPNPSLLKEYPQGSIITKLNDQFIEEQMTTYRADLQKAAEKLGIPLNEENLPAIAREMRAMKAGSKLAETNVKK